MTIPMATKDKKKDKSPDRTDDFSDSDNHDNPAISDGTDEIEEEEEFEFDASLLLEGVELVELTPDFIRPAGFLMVPREIKRTGEISPPEATFAGILNDIISWKDKDKERYWFSCTATSTIPNVYYVGRDDKTKESFQKPVLKGDRIGISCSGAIDALKSKKGHFILLHWTGARKPTKRGSMWEVIAKVSKDPVEKAPF
jgi:hypothetical protein